MCSIKTKRIVRSIMLMISDDLIWINRLHRFLGYFLPFWKKIFTTTRGLALESGGKEFKVVSFTASKNSISQNWKEKRMFFTFNSTLAHYYLITSVFFIYCLLSSSLNCPYKLCGGNPLKSMLFWLPDGAKKELMFH